MWERLLGAAQLLPLLDPQPWGLQTLPLTPSPHPLPSSGAAAALPGCFIYLFCTNGVAADSFSPGLKREREEKKCFLVLFSTSVLAAVAAAATAAAAGRAGGLAGGWAGRWGAVGVSTRGGADPGAAQMG